MQRIGLISDTHGLLRAEAVAFLQGCDRIVHAGDICDPAILEALARIAPVDAVRGNNDRGAWAESIGERFRIRIEGVELFAVHDVADLATAPLPHDVAVVVHGHSHRPTTVDRDGVLYVNPGSAGPRRFSLPVSIGELRIDGAKVQAKLVTLAA